ncbi:MAG: hypothetical protein LWX51_00800 [Deltaproteobacteria bacterium]|jgi:hypothetical protein|nr:hypothetical protein [Deltaproteobacteria bacterium]
MKKEFLRTTFEQKNKIFTKPPYLLTINFFYSQKSGNPRYLTRDVMGEVLLLQENTTEAKMKYKNRLLERKLSASAKTSQGRMEK